jgi:hypothetical protein
VLDQWASVINAAAAPGGDTQAAEALAPLLAEVDKALDWAALGGVLVAKLEASLYGDVDAMVLTGNAHRISASGAALAAQPPLVLEHIHPTVTASSTRSLLPTALIRARLHNG